MLVIKSGDVLKASENIICHQVNPDGVMGGGLALAIARRFQSCLGAYKRFCEDMNYDYEKLKGLVLAVRINDNQEIANCFTQDPNFNTDYETLREAFKEILYKCRKEKKTIAMPYNYGCGIANGNWNKVTEILEELSDMYEVDINIYKLGD